MAFFRLEAKIISRERRGRSVIAAAAYRAGSKIRDERNGRQFDYTRRQEGVIETTILTPEKAPAWASESSQLWNTVERSEKRVDAQLAREFILAVPPELSAAEQFRTAKDWAERELVSKGMITEVSLHHTKSGNNPHVHILCTMRELDGDNFSAKKPREWNEKKLLYAQRKSWAGAVNAALEKAGRPERVDHRTLKEQGIDREPQPKIGVAATAMQRKGVETERVQVVRQTKISNEALPFFKAIRQRGEVNQVRQHGVGSRWWQHPVTFMARVRDQAVRFAQETWHKLIGSRTRQPERGSHDMER